MTTINGDLKISGTNRTLKKLAEDSYIVEYSNLANGYIRLSNGIQIAWQSKNITAGGTEWNTSTKMWYSDHSMNDWAKPFNTTPHVIFANVGALQFWCTIADCTPTNPGKIRCYRPNNSTLNCQLHVFAIGTWE